MSDMHVETVLSLLTYGQDDLAQLRRQRDAIASKMAQLEARIGNAKTRATLWAGSDDYDLDLRIQCYALLKGEEASAWIAYINLMREQGPDDMYVIEIGKKMADVLERRWIFRSLVRAAEAEYKRLHNGVE